LIFPNTRRLFPELAFLLTALTFLFGCTSERMSQRPESTESSPKTAPPPGVPSTAPIGNTPATQEPAPLPELQPAAITEVPPLDPTKPILTAPDGTTLPQTDERPTLDSSWFKENAARLFSAIVKDDAESALSFFFPKLAYAQVKAIADPDHDYETRLLKAFEADIHQYHQALGARRDETTFVELRVYEPGAKWVKPGQEGNRLGYFRVLRSVIIYRDHENRSRELALHTMISWRGEWYVIHLGSFK
jgi:hypothetical protein